MDSFTIRGHEELIDIIKAVYDMYSKYEYNPTIESFDIKIQWRKNDFPEIISEFKGSESVMIGGI